MNKPAKSSNPSPVEAVASQFNGFHRNKANKLIHYFTIPFLTFAVLGLIWSIPFPHLDFLGRYNGFVNWASFVIAIAVYYYYRISQVLSYAILLAIFAFSACIVGLEKLHMQQGWPEMWQVCAIVCIVSWCMQFYGHKIEGRSPGIAYSFKTFVNGPVWLFYSLLRKTSIKL